MNFYVIILKEINIYLVLSIHVIMLKLYVYINYENFDISRDPLCFLQIEESAKPAVETTTHRKTSTGQKNLY